MKPEFALTLSQLIKQLPANRNGLVTPHLPLLSRSLGGFEKEELIVITAPPGTGKTQLARTLSIDFIKQAATVLYISFESSYPRLLRMFLDCGLAEIDEAGLLLKPDDTWENDISFIEELAAKNKPDVIIVDDIHALEEKYSGLRKTDNMAVVMRGLAGRLKEVAVKNQLIMITMAHMRKDTMNNKSSSLSDIAYSGGVAQVADTVLSIKRLEKSTESIIEVIKARHTGDLKAFKVNGENKIFNEIAYYDQTSAELVGSIYNHTQRKL